MCTFAGELFYYLNMSATVSVIKIGGNILDDPESCSRFLQRFAALTSPRILVHGGGKIATQTAARLQIPTRMVDGRRITDKAMLDVVTMVYGGLVNKNLVAGLQSLACNAIGLTGADAGIIRAVKRPVKAIDYGFVGDITAVNEHALTTFLNNDLVPVLAPLTCSDEGLLLNTNADTIASATAVALARHYPVTLVYCFEKKGVLSNADDDESVISSLNPVSYIRYKNEGVITKGMIPKLDNAFQALASGVQQVIICHADNLDDALAGKSGTLLNN